MPRPTYLTSVGCRGPRAECSSCIQLTFCPGDPFSPLKPGEPWIEQKTEANSSEYAVTFPEGLTTAPGCDYSKMLIDWTSLRSRLWRIGTNYQIQYQLLIQFFPLYKVVGGWGWEIMTMIKRLKESRIHPNLKASSLWKASEPSQDFHFLREIHHFSNAFITRIISTT